jgi:hypothetical protein
MKLYRVTTIVKEFHDCKDVPFHWFRHDRGKRCAYDELIENYDPSDHDARDAEGAIDELFTDIEANMLKEYLDQEHGGAGTTTIAEVHLPIARNSMGVGAIPVGGGDDFYMLSKEPAYTLPFEAWAYFDLVDCALADGSGVYHMRCWLVSPDGNWRLQTNEEAAAEAAAPLQTDRGGAAGSGVAGHSPPAWLR